MRLQFNLQAIGVVLILLILFSFASIKSSAFILDPVFDRDIQIDKISVSGYNVRTAIVYDYISDSFKKRTNINDLIYFDEKGYPSEKIFYNSNGEIVKTEKYHYDEQSNLIAIYIQIPGDPTNYDINFKYKKDSEGRLIERSAYNFEGNLISYYKYNYSGNKLISEEKYNADNILISKICYTYDQNNNLIKSTEYRLSKNNPFIFRENFYNSNNTIYAVNQYSNDGKLFYSCNQKYDSNNNLIESICINSQNKLHWKYVLIYDDKNLLSEKIIFSDESTPYEKIVFSYENEEENKQNLGAK